MTMHRVQNVGSVLQAYALLHKIEQMGHEAEIIDYEFPPIKKEYFIVKDVLKYGWNAFLGFPREKTKRKLEEFRKQFLHCSNQTFSRNALLSNPPQYDIYCTGSDQVWNPLHVGKDTSFFLDFAPEASPRIAYASSFASQDICEPYRSLYAQLLAQYKYITVREQSGVGIVKRLTGKDASVVCDPTLLLTIKEWEDVSALSKINISGGYIFVYLLGYMFDPRPEFYNIVKSVSLSLQLPVYYFNPQTKDIFESGGGRALLGMGPKDFVRLVKNASFIVTDSFHGTAFATIFNIPMVAVVKDVQGGDGRISTLRKKVGASKSFFCPDEGFTLDCSDIEQYKGKMDKVDELRQASIRNLRDMIEGCSS